MTSCNELSDCKRTWGNLLKVSHQLYKEKSSTSPDQGSISDMQFLPFCRVAKLFCTNLKGKSWMSAHGSMTFPQRTLYEESPGGE